MIQLLKKHIQNKDAAKIIQLIQANPEVLDIKDDTGSTGFMLIVYAGVERTVAEAIVSKKSFTFHEAIVVGKMNMVKKYLINTDDDIANAWSYDGFTALSLAAFFNQTDIAKLLVDKGADPNLHATNPTKVNALHAAVAKENYELCRLFIEKGVDVNAVQTQQVTALHAAAQRGNLKLIKLLVENGAIVHSKMENGDTSIDIAKREGHRHVEEYLFTYMK